MSSVSEGRCLKLICVSGLFRFVPLAPSSNAVNVIYVSVHVVCQGAMWGSVVGSVENHILTLVFLVYCELSVKVNRVRDNKVATVRFSHINSERLVDPVVVQVSSNPHVTAIEELRVRY